ncbi:E3 ubiquitin-protein ligase mib1 [Branchiostoma belcheri]|nr:E3 ubiquitin-protein ligase mib1 [Branchiostoma belcheri]
MAKRHYRTDLARGDHVRIPESVDTVTLKEKQKGHGGYADVIAKVDKTEDLLVGDLVKISSDEDKVKEKQKGHGEWVDDMKSSLDHTGRVVKILPSQDVRVKIKGRTWTYNRTVLLKIESPECVGVEKEVQAVMIVAGAKDVQENERNYLMTTTAFTYILTSAIAILRSCARVSDNHPYLREAKIEDRLRKLVHFNDPVIACSATLILGHIIRDPGDECLRLTQQITSYMARCMGNSLDARENDQEEKLDPESFLSLDIAMGISALACRDDNRRSFLRNGFVPLLMRLITVGNDLEKEHATKALHALANSEKTQQEMSENEDLTKLLTKVARDDEDGGVKAAASDALAMIQYGPEGHYEYDVFVSCNSMDRSWVEYHLRPLLEKDMELSVCLYYRDFLPGDSIQESVIRAIKNSRRAAKGFEMAIVPPGNQIIIGAGDKVIGRTILQGSDPHIFTDVDLAYDTVLYAARPTTRLPAPRVTEHWNDPVRNPLLRDFGTCYPVVNGLRALANEC